MTDHTEDYASTLDEHWPAAASHMRKLKAENKRLREALAPSGATKAAYIGEFAFTIPLTDDEGEIVPHAVDVPWATIKEIMRAIQERAALGEG